MTHMTAYMHLIGVGDAGHTTHHAEHVIVNGVHAHLGGGSARNGGGREHQLEGGVINAGEVAGATGLVFLGAQGKGVHIDAAIGGTGVVLVGLDHVEVRAFTFREAILAVKLELSGDDGVLAPAVHVEGSLGEHESAGIGDGRARLGSTGLGVEGKVSGGRAIPHLGSGGRGGISSTGHLEEAGGVDEVVSTGGLRRATKSVDGIGEGIDRVGVVEGLSTQGAEKGSGGIQRRAVVHVGIGLNNPDQFLARVVEVELDLVGRRANGFVTSELELLNEVLVGVLRHLAAFIGIQEDIVDVEGSRNEGLLVGLGEGLSSRGRAKGLDGPEALTNRAEINVDLDFVVLESNQGEGKAGVAAKPEQQGDVEGGLRERVAGSAHLSRATSRRARARDVGEGGVSDVGELSGVANHLEVATLLLLVHGELIPDVHPVTVLAVNALTTDFNLNLGDELLTNVVQPAGIDTVRHVSSGGGRVHHLVDLGKSDLEVSAVAEITVTGDRAGHAATKVGLARESLFDGFHREVSVASVGHLPESNFRSSREENILRTVSNQLHQSTSHFLLYTIPKENNFGKSFLF